MEENQKIIIEIGTKIDNSGFTDLQQHISETSDQVAGLNRQISGVGQNLSTEVGKKVQDIRLDRGVDKADQVNISPDMPNINAILQNQISKLSFTQKHLLDRIGHVEADERNGVYSGFNGAKKRERELSRVSELKDDYLTMSQMLLGNGDFSVSMAHSMLAGLPSAIKKELDAIAPEVSSALRKGFSSGALKAGSNNLGNLVYDARALPKIRSLMSQAGQRVETSGSGQKLDGEQIDLFLKTMLPTAAPIQAFRTYSSIRHKNTAPNFTSWTSVEDILPQYFKGSHDNKRLTLGSFSGSTLSSAGAADLLSNISNNGVALRAAKRSGLVRVGSDGNISFAQSAVSKDQLSAYAESLYDEFVTRTSGLYSDKKIQRGKYYDDKNQEAIIKRGHSGTGGETLAAMSALSDVVYGDTLLRNPNAQVKYAVNNIRGAQNVRDKKDIFTVQKIAPFSLDKNGNPEITESSIQESFATRAINEAAKALGGTGYGNYSNLSAVKEISAKGFDKSDRQKAALLENYIKNGYFDENGVQYKWAGFHGTGEDTVNRFVRADIYDAVRQRYNEDARRIFGEDRNVWNGFVPEGFQFEKRSELGKHYDMMGKIWSDTNVVASPDQLRNKKFVVVDYNNGGIKYADGVGYVSNDILKQGSIQARFGLGGKGSLVPMAGSTFGDSVYGKSLLDKDGRIMMKGVGGEMIDVAGAAGVLDVSLIKNLNAFRDSEGNMLTGNALNEAVTKMIQTTGIDAIYDYSQDSTGVSSLGSQMSAYIRYNPEMGRAQGEAIIRRLNEVDTLEGARKFVFNNPDEDEISRKINDPIEGSRYFEAMYSGESSQGRAIRERIETYKKSLLQKVSSGDFVNTGDIADITKARIVSNPGLSNGLYAGGFDKLSDAEKSTITKAFTDNFGNVFTQDQIAQMWDLRGGIADFTHTFFNKEGIVQKGSESPILAETFLKNLGDKQLTDEQFGSIFQDVAALVSPTGFGQTMVRKNFAPVLSKVYESLGLFAGQDGNSVMLNDKDLKYLSTRDQDGDILKLLTDVYGVRRRYGVSFVDQLKEQERLTNEFIESRGLDPASLVPKVTEINTPKEKNVVGNTDAIVEGVHTNVNVAPLKMGAASKAGTRATQLDLLNPALSYFANAALLANNMYDESTTLFKSPKEIQTDAMIYSALGLGKEFREFPNALTGLFDVTKKTGAGEVTFLNSNGDELDAKDIVEYKDIGNRTQLMNLRALRDLEVDKVNLPSVMSDNMIFAMEQLSKMSKAGVIDDTFTDNIMEALGVGTKTEGLGFDNAVGQQSTNYLRNKRTLLAQFATGRRFSITDEEANVLASQVQATEEELVNYANTHQQNGLIDGVKIGDWISGKRKEFGLNQMRLALGSYSDPTTGIRLATGLVQENIRNKYGQEKADALSNLSSTTLDNMEYGVFADELGARRSVYSQGYGEDFDPTKLKTVYVYSGKATTQTASQNPAQAAVDAANNTAQKMEEAASQVENANARSSAAAKKIEESNKVTDEEVNAHLDNKTSSANPTSGSNPHSGGGSSGNGNGNEEELVLSVCENCGSYFPSSYHACPYCGHSYGAPGSGQDRINKALENSREVTRGWRGKAFGLTHKDGTEADSFFGRGSSAIRQHREDFNNAINQPNGMADPGTFNRLSLDKENIAFIEAWQNVRQAAVNEAISRNVQNVTSAYGNLSSAKTIAQQLGVLSSFDQSSNSLESWRKNYNNSINEEENPYAIGDTKENIDGFNDKINSSLKSIKEMRDQAIDQFMTQNAEYFDEVANQFQSIINNDNGKNNFGAKIQNKIKSVRQSMDETIASLDERLENGLISEDDYRRISSDLNKQRRNLASGSHDDSDTFGARKISEITAKRNALDAQLAAKEISEDDYNKQISRLNTEFESYAHLYGQQAERKPKTLEDRLFEEYFNDSNKGLERLKNIAEYGDSNGHSTALSINAKKAASKYADEVTMMKEAAPGTYTDQQIKEAEARAEEAKRYSDTITKNQNDKIIRSNKMDLSRLRSGLFSPVADKQSLINLALDQKNLEIDNRIATLKADKNNGVYDGRLDEYNRLKEEADRDKEFLNSDSYRQSLEKQYETQEGLRLAQRRAHLQQLSTREDRLRRGRAGVYGNSFIDRAIRQRDNEYMQRESIDQQYNVELARLQHEQSSYLIAHNETQRLNQELQRTDLSDEQRAQLTQQRDQYSAGNARYDELASDMDAVNSAIASNKAAMESLNNPIKTVNASFQQLGMSVGQVAQRLGRQVLMKAFNEAKRFVQEFDAQMTEIQMITMNNEADMKNIKDTNVIKASYLKASVSDVAKVQAALYRQGLSETETNTRTDDIIKFSKVTGTSVDKATKYLTTAVNSGLVGSLEQAMDVMAALGDTAATTAEEIAKGMQKSAASANMVGVSFNSLTAMLTAITAGTQLGGTTAGTALNTMFSRINRVTSDNFAKFENGESVDRNDVAKALRNAGITATNKDGSFRSVEDIVLDVSKQWNYLNDMQKNNLMYVLGGTRQQNTLSTMFDAFSEDNGAKLEEYLNTAKNASGTTDAKYDVYLNSLAASLQSVKTSYDSLIESMSSSTDFSGIFDWVSSAIEGFSNFADKTKGWGAAFVAFAAVLGVFASAVFLSGQAVTAALEGYAGIVRLGAAAVAVGATLGAASLIGSKMSNDKDTQKALMEQEENRSKFFSNANADFSNAEQSIKAIKDLLNSDESIDLSTSIDFQNAQDQIESFLFKYGITEIEITPELNEEKLNDISNKINDLKANYAKMDIMSRGSEVSQMITEFNNKYSGLGNVSTATQSDGSIVLTSYQKQDDGTLDPNNQVVLTKGQYNADNLFGFVQRANSPEGDEIFGQANSALFNLMYTRFMNDYSQGNIEDEDILSDIEKAEAARQKFSTFGDLITGINDNNVTSGSSIWQAFSAYFVKEFSNADVSGYLGFNKQADTETLMENIAGMFASTLSFATGIDTDTVKNAALNYLMQTAVKDGNVNYSDVNLGAMTEIFTDGSYRNYVDYSKMRFHSANGQFGTNDNTQSYTDLYNEAKDEYNRLNDIGASNLTEKEYARYLFLGQALSNNEGTLTDAQIGFKLANLYGMTTSVEDHASGLVLGMSDSDKNYAKQRSELKTIFTSSGVTNMDAYEEALIYSTLTPGFMGGLEESDNLFKLLEDYAARNRDDETAFSLFKTYGSSLTRDSGFDGFLKQDALSLLGGNAKELMRNYASWTKDEESVNENLGLIELLKQIDESGALVNALETGDINDVTEALRSLNEQLTQEQLENIAKFGNYLEDAGVGAKMLSDDVKESSDAVTSFRKTVTDYRKQIGALERYIKGKASKEDRNTVAEMLGYDDAGLKELEKDGDKAKKVAEKKLKEVEKIASKSVQSNMGGKATAAGAKVEIDDELTTDKIEEMQAELLEAEKTKTIEGEVPINLTADTNLEQFDLTPAQKAVAEQLKSGLEGTSITMPVIISGDGEVVTAKLGDATVNGLGKGGGGGGGKSKVDKLLEKWQRRMKLYEHEISMNQKSQDFYDKQGRFTDERNEVEEEIEIRKAYNSAYQEQLDAYMKMLAKTKEGSDDWYKLRDAIIDTEDAIKDNNVALVDATNKIKDLDDKILKTQTDLEKTIDEEIKTRIQEQEQMIQGAADMESTIADLIRERYQKEWDLIKEDIDKKKQALEEEKNLINERLQARKSAEDESAKYTQLQQYQQQLAMVEMDSTRTKDAAELRKKIADLQKEIGWSIAENEADTQTKIIEDQINSYDEFTETGDESLEKFLENANNFAGEITEVLGKSREELMDWLSSIDENYINSLSNTQQTIIKGWTDTFKQMNGIIDTYWYEVMATMSTSEEFVNYMKDSTTYKTASDAQKVELERQWAQQYEDFVNARLVDATAETHLDNALEKISSKNKKTNAKNMDIVDNMAQTDIDRTYEMLFGDKNQTSKYEGLAAQGVKDAIQSGALTDMLLGQGEWATEITSKQKDLDSMVSYASTLNKNSDEFYNVRDAIFELETEIFELSNSMMYSVSALSEVFDEAITVAEETFVDSEFDRISAVDDAIFADAEAKRIEAERLAAEAAEAARIAAEAKAEEERLAAEKKQKEAEEKAAEAARKAEEAARKAEEAAAKKAAEKAEKEANEKLQKQIKSEYNNTLGLYGVSYSRDDDGNQIASYDNDSIKNVLTLAKQYDMYENDENSKQILSFVKDLYNKEVGLRDEAHTIYNALGKNDSSKNQKNLDRLKEINEEMSIYSDTASDIYKDLLSAVRSIQAQRKAAAVALEATRTQKASDLSNASAEAFVSAFGGDNKNGYLYNPNTGRVYDSNGNWIYGNETTKKSALEANGIYGGKSSSEILETVTKGSKKWAENNGFVAYSGSDFDKYYGSNREGGSWYDPVTGRVYDDKGTWIYGDESTTSENLKRLKDKANTAAEAKAKAAEEAKAKAEAEAKAAEETKAKAVAEAAKAQSEASKATSTTTTGGIPESVLENEEIAKRILNDDEEFYLDPRTFDDDYNPVAEDKIRGILYRMTEDEIISAVYDNIYGVLHDYEGVKNPSIEFSENGKDILGYLIAGPAYDIANYYDSMKAEQYQSAAQSIASLLTGGLYYLLGIDEQAVAIPDLSGLYEQTIATPDYTGYDTSKLSGSSNSIGSVNVNITGAEISSDADIDYLAQRIGEQFSQELSKQGFNTSNYGF